MHAWKPYTNFLIWISKILIKKVFVNVRKSIFFSQLFICIIHFCDSLSNSWCSRDFFIGKLLAYLWGSPLRCFSKLSFLTDPVPSIRLLLNYFMFFILLSNWIQSTFYFYYFSRFKISHFTTVFKLVIFIFSSFNFEIKLAKCKLVKRCNIW